MSRSRSIIKENPALQLRARNQSTYGNAEEGVGAPSSLINYGNFKEVVVALLGLPQMHSMSRDTGPDYPITG